MTIDSLSLFCYVRGDDGGEPFKVDIDKEETVSHLRKVIKENKKPRFDDIPADTLSLWKVSLQFSENLKNEVESLNLVDGGRLMPVEKLSKIFSDMEKKRVHVVVDRPRSASGPVSTSIIRQQPRVTSGRSAGILASHSFTPYESALQQ